jgi:NitT/TauT family transport system substrate-binding protein
LNRHRFAALAVAGALLASATGCGRREARSSLDTVRIFCQPHLTAAPLYLAESAGYFGEAGLAVDWVRTGSSRDLLPSLLEGDLDVLTANLSPVFLNAAAQGARLRIVADKGHLARDGCNYLSFLTRPELLRDGRIERPSGGRKLRVSYRRGSLYEMLFDRALAASGLDRDETELHFLSGEVENQALVEGGLDITTNSGAPLQKLVESGGAAVWLRAQDLLPDGQAFVVLFGPRLLDSEPGIGERFMAAYLRGVRQYNLGKIRENVAIVAAALETPAEEIERACWIAIREDGRIDMATVAALADWARANGRLDAPLDHAAVWEPRFVESAAAELGRTAARDAARNDRGGAN